MNKKNKNINTGQLIQMLPEAFEIPRPLQKEKFLQEIERSRRQQPHSLQQSISYREFIFIQIRYIRKITWCLSLVLLLFTFVGMQLIEQKLLWCLASLIPFLAVCGVTEHMRSENYGMTELEMASRFSLKSVMFARLGILGVVHFVLMTLMIFMANQNNTFHLLETAVYLMVPYFMTTFSGLWMSRKIHGKESVYACMGAAVMVSMLQNILSYMQELVYTADLFQWWFVGFLLLILFTVKEVKTILAGSECIA